MKAFVCLGLLVTLGACASNPSEIAQEAPPADNPGSEVDFHGIHSENTKPNSIRYIPSYRRGAAMYTPSYQHVVGLISNSAEPTEAGADADSDELDGLDGYENPSASRGKMGAGMTAKGNKSVASNRHPQKHKPVRQKTLNGVPVSIWDKYCDPERTDQLTNHDRKILGATDIPAEYIDQCGFTHK